MLTIGNTDAFEQSYMAKFEKLATEHGVFVRYEKDRAARDIGLHLTRSRPGGGKQVMNAIVWFQMKGVMANTLSAEAFEKQGGVNLSMDVEHLRHWFLEKEPTHLVVYVEAVDQFLVLNLQAYIEAKWGRKILTLEQKTATVEVSKSSTLDKQAFALLLRQANCALWMKALDIDYDTAKLLDRHWRLILRFGSGNERGVEFSAEWIDWISKARDEIRFFERPVGSKGDWEKLYEHWEYMGFDPQADYPYLAFSAGEDNEEPELVMNEWGEWHYESDSRFYELANGETIFGPEALGEFYSFDFAVELNEYGQKLLGMVNQLAAMGLTEANEEGKTQFISVAPWHGRHV